MPNNLKATGNILSKLLEDYNINESELSRAIKLPRATINRLISGRTPDPRASTLKAIAQYFEISVDQLLGVKPIYNGGSVTSPDINSDIAIPILKWEELLNWQTHINSLTQANHDHWIHLDSKNEQGKFALFFEGESMWPRFPANTYLIIEPNKAINTRDYCIAYCQSCDEVVFRQIIIEGHYRLLKPVNNIFPTIHLKNGDFIIGALVEARYNF